ncbi:MAG: nuclear transport factor 2 family protein [Myxococcales bacterium]|nr:nuclear transport factor 2 family protein [Myxococcales bacterium]
MTRAAIKHGEQRLRGAMLASDVDELDALLDDALVFSTPDGQLLRKEDELEVHRSGAQKLTRLDPRELVIELHGADIGIATALVDLAGTFRDQPVAGTYRYVRTWRRDEDGAWRVIAGAVVPVSS